MGGIFSSPTKETKEIKNPKLYDCSTCSWKPVDFCGVSNDSKSPATYDASCHDYQVKDPRNHRNKVTTHGYECITDSNVYKNEGLYHCNTNICKANTLKCNESDIPPKPSGGDYWPAETYTRNNIEISCKEYLEKSNQDKKDVNYNFLKNKCGELFEEHITSDKNAFKKYCDDHFFKYPNSTKYKNRKDCYKKEAPIFAKDENTYCKDYFEKYPLNDKYQSIEDCEQSRSELFTVYKNY